MKRKQRDSRLTGLQHRTDAVALQTSMQWHSLEGAEVRMASFAVTDGLDPLPLLPTLSAHEVALANTLSDALEREHYILRRAFQRSFAAELLQWTRPLPELPLLHQRDQRTVCEVAPKMMFSFSSSQGHYCACASQTRDVGIDIEKRRHIENVEALAARFFTRDEVQQLRASPQAERHGMFLHVWTAKEAGLKAAGLGIVAGLDRVQIVRNALNYHIKQPISKASDQAWQLAYPDIVTSCVIAVVHRLRH
jgi:phosphopantetheine--protein transferase-like protein